jgi:ABC-2 type transport system ATP-binding protein
MVVPDAGWLLRRRAIGKKVTGLSYADQISDALDGYRRGDLTVALDLFAPRVHWESLTPGEAGCRDRGDVEAMLDAARRDGVDGSVTVEPVGSAAVVGFHRRDPAGETEPRWCVMWFDSGRVVQVRPFRVRSAALAAAATGQPSPSPVLLSAADVSKSYRGRRVLGHVSLDVRVGEAVAVVGENGVGKTTLLRICAGLVAPDTGTVAVHGPVGYCPQEPGVLDRLTADEHLVLFGAATGLPRTAALDRGRALLDELGVPVADKTVARELSGGTRQKLNLALALLGEPTVILLDEPYQAFDRGSYVSFWRHVDGWRHQGKAVVIVTHLLTEVERVDRVVELSVPSSEDRA